MVEISVEGGANAIVYVEQAIRVALRNISHYTVDNSIYKI